MKPTMSELEDDLTAGDLPSRPLSGGTTDDVVRKIYDTALDNSLWPQMILSVYETLESMDGSVEVERAQMRVIQEHFIKSFQLSERLVKLQGELDLARRGADGIAVQMTLYDADRQRLDGTGRPALPEADTLRATPEEADLPAVTIAEDGGVELLVGPDLIGRLDLPANVAWAAIRLEPDAARIGATLGLIWNLQPSRERLLTAWLDSTDLRIAAEEAQISYETARTYMKDICAKAGVTGQRELLKAALSHPATLLKGIARPLPAEDVRRLIRRPDGSAIEVFVLGPADAPPILHYDALTGGALDLLGHPERYAPLLDALNRQLVILCRPGTFRSDFVAQDSARDYGADARIVLDALRQERAAILAYSYGSVAALGTAQTLGERIERVVLASVSFPDYIAPDWRSMDFFYQVSRVIGQRWPGLLRRVIPFLANSILQNIDNFSDRAAARADCAHEEALLMEPQIRTRSRKMLSERIAQGMRGLVQEYQIIARRLDFDVERLNVPLHLFHGAEDRINPLGGAEALAARALDARLDILPGRGHAFIYAEWDWLLAAAAGAPFDIPGPDRRGILTEWTGDQGE